MNRPPYSSTFGHFIWANFSYGDAANHVARLLDRLAAEGFNIMLHLVQPFSAARNMLLPEAQAEWRDFVVSTLERFGGRIESLEIGSTINRKRWAGYTLDGFLAMWGLAHAEARARGLRLAGPSITDFEPNIGVLSTDARWPWAICIPPKTCGGRNV